MGLTAYFQVLQQPPRRAVQRTAPRLNPKSVKILKRVIDHRATGFGSVTHTPVFWIENITDFPALAFPAGEIDVAGQCAVAQSHGIKIAVSGSTCRLMVCTFPCRKGHSGKPPHGRYDPKMLLRPQDGSGE